MLMSSGLRPLPDIVRPEKCERLVLSDIPVIGEHGLKVLDDVGVYLIGSFNGCVGCGTCEKGCPERALKVIGTDNGKYTIKIATEFCLGTACKRCEASCPEHVYYFRDLKVTGGSPLKKTDRSLSSYIKSILDTWPASDGGLCS